VLFYVVYGLTVWLMVSGLLVFVLPIYAIPEICLKLGLVKKRGGKEY